MYSLEMYRNVLKYTTKHELLNMVSEQGFESYPENCSLAYACLFFPSPENSLFLSPLPNMSSYSESEHNTGASQSDSMMTELTAKITEALGKVQTPSLTTEPVAAPIGIKLDNNNYALWSQVVEMYVSGKDKLGFINGDSPQPPSTDPTFRRWLTDNAIVKG